MQNNLTLFDYNDSLVRTLSINDEPWFVGKDIASILGYSNPQKAVRDHVDEEDRTVNDSFTVNGTSPVLINESGVYSLIFSSKLPEAKKFKHWVTSEVLPAIRETGQFSPKRTAVDYLNLELLKLEHLKEYSKKTYEKAASALIQKVFREDRLNTLEKRKIAKSALYSPISKEVSEEAIKIGETLSIRNRPAAEVYQEYLAQAGEEPLSRVLFTKAVKSLGYEVRIRRVNKKSTRVYVRI